jgi:hypothetical protein
MKLSRFDSNLDRHPQLVEVTWDELIAQLRDVHRAPCAADTCGKGEHEHLYIDRAGNERRGGCRHKYIGAWSPAVYPSGATRGKNSVDYVEALVLDLDHLTDEELDDTAMRLEPYRYIAHATHGDRAGDRALRAVIAMSRPVSGKDWPRFWSAAMQALGMPADPSCCDASRLYFLPTRPSNLDYVFETNDGTALDVDLILAHAPEVAEVAQDRLAAIDVASREQLDAAADVLAGAWPARGRHRASLALCGALARVSWPESAIAGFVADVSRRADARLGTKNDGDYNKRLSQARDSIAKVHRGELVTGWGSLATAVPELAGVVDQARAALGMPEHKLDSSKMFQGAKPKEPSAAAAIFADSGIDLLESSIPDYPEGSYQWFLKRATLDVDTYLGAASVGADKEEPYFLPASRLFSDSYPATPWLVQGLMVEGGVAVIGGEAKSFKTWLATDIAVGIATGTRVVGQFDAKPGIVAYYYTEDLQVAVRNRVRALCSTRGLDPLRALDKFHFQPRGRDINLTDNAACARIIASARMLGKVSLILLDPLRNIHNAKENESDDMREVFKRVSMIGTLVGCTMLISHHMKKPSKDSNAGQPGLRLRGSGAIHGFVDSGIYLEDLRGNETTVFTNTVRSQVKSARSAGAFELTLTIDDDSNGEAKHATWTKGISGETAPALADIETWEETALRCIECIAVNTAKRLPAMTRDQVRKEVKQKTDTVRLAVEYAIKQRWIERDRNYKLVLTELGQRRVEQMVDDRAEPEPVVDPSVQSSAWAKTKLE